MCFSVCGRLSIVFKCCDLVNFCSENEGISERHTTSSSCLCVRKTGRDPMGVCVALEPPGAAVTSSPMGSLASEPACGSKVDSPLANRIVLVFSNRMWLGLVAHITLERIHVVPADEEEEEEEEKEEGETFFSFFFWGKTSTITGWDSWETNTRATGLTLQIGESV